LRRRPSAERSPSAIYLAMRPKPNANLAAPVSGYWKLAGKVVEHAWQPRSGASCDLLKLLRGQRVRLRQSLTVFVGFLAST
jgi:hypothetical protein